MKLTLENLKNREAWERAGISLPAYDVAALAERTKKAPVWVHMGIGNIFRRKSVIIRQLFRRSGFAKRGKADPGYFLRLMLTDQLTDIRSETAIYIVIFHCYDPVKCRYYLQQLFCIFPIQNIHIAHSYMDSFFFQHFCRRQHTIQYKSAG